MNAESKRLAGAARGESGNALVAALLVLMVLTAAGVAFVAVTKSEKQISGNAVMATEAFYNAEAGISEGLYRMSFKKDSLNFIGPNGPETPGWAATSSVLRARARWIPPWRRSSRTGWTTTATASSTSPESGIRRS